jgi:Conserved protein containing a Zn-ribbon-like motif, possibly RNA-binding
VALKEPGPPPLDRVADLLNTDDRFHGRDLLREPEVLDRVFAHLDLPDSTDVDDLRRLRDALRTLVVGEPDPDALAEVAARHPLTLGIVDGAPALRGDDGVAIAIERVQRTVAAGTWARLRSCRNPDCGWIYYDSSKNRSGRWCSTECSTVMRTRTYRSRHAG